MNIIEERENFSEKGKKKNEPGPCTQVPRHKYGVDQQSSSNADLGH